MKQILSFLLFLLPALAFAQWPAAPNKIRLGNQTTGDGLIVRTDSIPDWTPADRNNAWLAFDTVANLLYFYEGGTWQEYASGGGGGVQYSDSLTTFVTPTMLADTAAAIRGDFPTDTNTNLANSDLTQESEFRTYDQNSQGLLFDNANGFYVQGTGIHQFIRRENIVTFDLIRRSTNNTPKNEDIVIINAKGKRNGSESTFARIRFLHQGDTTQRTGAIDFIPCEQNAAGNPSVRFTAVGNEKYNIFGDNLSSYSDADVIRAINTFTTGESDVVSPLRVDNTAREMLFEINGSGTLRAGKYTTGTKTASVLGKTESGYIAAFATDGTVIEIPKSSLTNTNLAYTGAADVIELDAGGTPVYIAEGSGVDVTQSGDTLTITGKGTRFVQDSITGATLTIDLNEAPTAIISLKMTSATSVTLTISNPYGLLTDATAPTYEGETGVYTFRFWGISGTDNVTWPANFYDMNGTALGTDALTAGTAYTCYYDPIANEYYCK